MNDRKRETGAGPRRRTLQDPRPSKVEKSQQRTGEPEPGVIKKIHRKAGEWGVRGAGREPFKEGGFTLTDAAERVS